MKPARRFPLLSTLPEGAVRAEQQAAGIPAEGVRGWTFTRAFNYWVANGTGLPVAKAKELHATAPAGELLPDGHKGGAAPDEVATGGSIRLYHATTPRALKALVQAVS